MNFDTHIVAAVQYSENATCGMEIASHGIWTGIADSVPQVYLQIADASGTCFATCDMEQSLGVMYAVPRDRDWPEVCLAALNSCG